MSSSSAAPSYGAVPKGDEDDVQTAFVKKRRCNDVLFALAFLAHLGYILYSWITYEPPTAAAEDAEEHEYIDDFMDRGVWKYVGTATAVALILSTLTLFFMSTFADELVEIALSVSILCTAVVAGYGVYIWKVWMMVVGGVACLSAVIFAWYVWKTIPFAAANLRTALTAVKTNFGLIFFSYTLEVVAFAWTVLWIDAAGSTLSQTGADHWTLFLFLYLLSFFWTQQVINNLQHTIVSSIIGVWWYNPTDANSCWDDGMNRAICHSLTLSFGSICFGSLLQGIIQALKWVHRITAQQSNKCGKCITAMIDCCLTCIQEALEYFNKWAFTFVGIHGDSYLESGRKVVSLFKQRGWSSLISDQLADAVMFTMKISISLVTGLTGWWLVQHDDDIFVGVGIEADDDDVIGFCAGCLIGFLVSSIMMELVGSAVTAVIVCFAEAPKTFSDHHPELCQEMLTAWKRAYPDECADDFDSVPTIVMD